MIDDRTAALAAIASVIDRDRADPLVDPRCVPLLLAGDAPADDAIVLLHGFTNCPRQFAVFAAQLHAAGAAVYVPRLPRHGMRDKLTQRCDGLTAAELRACGTAAVDLAAPLGRRVSVLGLSVGATLAAWLAQRRSLARAVCVAPFFSVNRVPGRLAPVLAATLRIVPNADLWWDPRQRDAIGPSYGYPRFSTHALAQCLALGRTVRSDAGRRSPATTTIVLALNGQDPAIDAGAARDVVRRWTAHGAATHTHVFHDLGERHDIIDPTTFADAVARVYPVLRALLLP